MSWHNTTHENPVEKRLEAIKGGDLEERNKLIEDYVPFVIKTVSKQLNRYIETENCDEFSVGLIAFNEAIDRHENDRGNFIKFAELVISNRIKDTLRKKNRQPKEISYEDWSDNEFIKFPCLSNVIDEETIDLREEIERYEKELARFQITFEMLAEETPKHKDTKAKAMMISEFISKEDSIVEELYKKRRLPLSKIVLKFGTTTKVIKRSRKYIISLVVIFTGGFTQLKDWVRNSLKGEEDV